MLRFLKVAWYRLKNLIHEPSTPQRPTTPPENPERPTKPVDFPSQGEFEGLRTNEKGIKLCMESEGYHTKLLDGNAKAYLCPARVWTIGWGTTVYHTGRKVREGDIINPEQARYEFLREMDEKENAIVKFMEENNLTYNENEFSALVSFAYNLGNAVVTSKNYSMGRAVLSQDRERIVQAFKLYVKAKNRWGIKVTLRGLVTRRNKEIELFKTPVG